MSYEGGPGWNVGTMTNLGNYIIAQRHAPMKDVLMNDVAGWEAAGGNSYNHFTLSGLYSRSGQWGHTEHYFNTTSESACCNRCAAASGSGRTVRPRCDDYDESCVLYCSPQVLRPFGRDGYASAARLQHVSEDARRAYDSASS